MFPQQPLAFWLVCWQGCFLLRVWFMHVALSWIAVGRRSQEDMKEGMTTGTQDVEMIECDSM